MKILIIEKDKHARNVLREVLNEFGKCELVEHGGQGLVAVETSIRKGSPYSLVCVDCHLSDRKAFHLLEHLRHLELDAKVSEERRARILVTSSLDDPRVAVETFRRGCESLLLKPLKRNRIAMELKRLGLSPR